MRGADLYRGPAAERSAVAWIEGEGIRGALQHYGLTLEQVGAWGVVGEHACWNARFDRTKFAGRFVGAIAAALVLGIELGREHPAS